MLLVEGGAAVGKHAQLFLQLLQFVLQRADAFVGCGFEPLLVCGDVEDRHAGGAAARDLERVVDQRGRQFLEDELLFTDSKIDGSGAGDDRAIQVNRRGGDGGVDRGAGAQGEGGDGYSSEAEGQTEVHGEKGRRAESAEQNGAKR